MLPSALSGTRLLGGNGQRHRGFRGLAFLAARYCPAGAEISKVEEVDAASGSKKVREYSLKAENVDSEGSDEQTCTDLGIMGARLGQGRHSAATRHSVPQCATPTPASVAHQPASHRPRLKISSHCDS